MKTGTHWKPSPPRKREEYEHREPPYTQETKVTKLQNEMSFLEKYLREQFALRRNGTDNRAEQIKNSSRRLRHVKAEIARLTNSERRNRAMTDNFGKVYST